MTEKQKDGAKIKVRSFRGREAPRDGSAPGDVSGLIVGKSYVLRLGGVDFELPAETGEDAGGAFALVAASERKLGRGERLTVGPSAALPAGGLITLTRPSPDAAHPPIPGLDGNAMLVPAAVFNVFFTPDGRFDGC